jgi:hypothetical protein
MDAVATDIGGDIGAQVLILNLIKSGEQSHKA